MRIDAFAVAAAFASPISGGYGSRICARFARLSGTTIEFKHRHCERSEAIHLSACCAMDCFAALAMTRRHTSAISPHVFARGVHLFHAPSSQRAQGKPDARCTRGLVCKLCKRMRTRAYRSSGGNPTFPAQWFDRLYVLSPAIRPWVVTVARAPWRELDASHEASGPHAFAVRLTRHSSKAHSAATASPPHVRDDRERPSEWDGMRNI
jgi:hypothetical protein